MKKIKIIGSLFIAADIAIHAQYTEKWTAWKLLLTGIIILLITGFFIERKIKKILEKKEISKFMLNHGTGYIPKN